MKHVRLFCTAALALLFASNSYGSITKASQDFCEKIKQCTYEEMAKEETLTPEMKMMMEGMLEQMCASLVPRTESIVGVPVLENKAVACLQSMNALSCDEISEVAGNTPECLEMEKARKKYMN